MIRTLALLPLIFFAAAAAAPAAAPRTLTFEDLRRVVTVRSPQISPDGKQIVYIRSKVDWKADRNRSELVLVNVDGTGARTLTHDRNGVDNPQWSPDGTRLAFLASPETGKPAQLYVMPMNGGDALQITTNKAGVQDYAWRPDGIAIAYVSDDDPANQKALDKHLDAVVITDNDYLTREAPQPAHLWLVNAAGGAATRLTSGTWSVVKNTAPVWLPDGSKIYYQRQPDAIFAHFVSQTTYAFDVASKSSTDLGYGTDSDPKLSRDGSLLAVSVPRHGSPYLQNDVSVRNTGTGQEVFNSRAVDRDVHWYDWQNAALLLGTADHVRNVAWRLNGQNNPAQVALNGVGFGGNATIARDGAVAFVGLNRDRPAEIYYLPAR